MSQTPRSKIPLVTVIFAAMLALAGVTSDAFKGALFARTIGEPTVPIASPGARPPVASPKAATSAATSSSPDLALPQPDSLTVYTALMEDEARIYVRAFENRTGIGITLIRRSTGEILNVLRLKESNVERADVVFGGPADMYILAAQEGLFEEYASPEAKHIPARLQDARRRWTGIYIGTIAFAVNRGRLDALGLPVPKSWADLVRPEYKGEICLANPFTSGTGYTVLATLAQILGNEGDYLRALDANIAAYTQSGAMPGMLAALGQVSIGVLFAQDVQRFQKRFPQLELVFPSEGTGYEIGGLAIVRGTRNLAAAKRFVSFMLSPGGQSLYAAMGEFRLPTNSLAHAAPEAVNPNSVGGSRYDPRWAARNRDQLLANWQQITQDRLRGDSAGR